MALDVFFFFFFSFFVCCVIVSFRCKIGEPKKVRSLISASYLAQKATLLSIYSTSIVKIIFFFLFKENLDVKMSRSSFRAVLVQFQSSFRTVSEQFQSSSGAVFRAVFFYTFRAVSEQFSFRAVSEQFQSSLVSEQFQSSFRAV